MSRLRLPNRRSGEAIAFTHEGIAYRACVSHFPDGELAEVFIDAVKQDSPVAIISHDLAVTASLALQFGCPVETLRKALTRLSNGDAAGPRGAVRVIELWSLPGRLAVDESVGTMGVEAQNPIADDLESDTADLRRPASRGAVVDRSESQQPARWRPVLRALGKRPQSTRIVILSKPNRRRHDEPPRVRLVESNFSRFENPIRESASPRNGISVTATAPRRR